MEVIMTKIMLVEDDKSLREIYGVRLVAEGYEIISAGDGEEGLAMAVKEKPDLILADVMMPKISGFDMLDILRSTPETKNVKVVMMTALSSEDQRARGESLGADRYLVKSQVGIEDVVRTVHDVLADTPVTAGAPHQAPATPAGPAASAVPQAPKPVEPAATPAPPTPPAPAQPTTPTVTPTQTTQPVVAPVAPQPVAPTKPVTTIPVTSAPTSPVTAPATTPAPAPQPVTSAPQPPKPAENPIPQPTAPFSTPAPASLGEKVISPISPDITEKKDISAMMEQELNGTAAPAPAQPVTPTDQQPAEPTSPATPTPTPTV